MYDLSDEATGLPPLNEVIPEEAIFAVQWMLGSAGLVSVNGDPVAVRYLSLRGLIQDDEGNPQHGQVHVALPSHGIRAMVDQWLEVLESEQVDSDERQEVLPLDFEDTPEDPA